MPSKKEKKNSKTVVEDRTLRKRRSEENRNSPLAETSSAQSITMDIEQNLQEHANIPPVNQPQPNVQIPLPKREFSKRTLTSIASNSLLLAGVGFNSLTSKGFKITGLACTFFGFASRQALHHISNNSNREKIKKQDINLTNLKRNKVNAQNINWLEPKHWTNNFGLKTDIKTVLTASIYSLLQLLAVGLTIWNLSATWNDEQNIEEPIAKPIIIATIILANVLESIVYHFEKDNLRRRTEQLEAYEEMLNNYPNGPNS